MSLLFPLNRNHLTEVSLYLIYNICRFARRTYYDVLPVYSLRVVMEFLVISDFITVL